MRFSSVVVGLFLLLPFYQTAAETVPFVIPTIVAEAAIVVEPSSGLILYEKKADKKRAVASTQKLLTALIVAEAGELDTEVKVERTDTRVEPAKVYIRTGRKYSRKVLLTAMLVKSGNDAARCLARDHAGGQDPFTAVLNARARKLGMGDSNFINANGLTVPDQYSTARDMAKLAIAAYGNADIREAVQTRKLNYSSLERYENTNELLKKFPCVNGMKTGYTSAAGRCLIASASYEGKEIIVVLLGSTYEDIWNDAEAVLRWTLKLPEVYPPVEEPKKEDDATN